MARRVLGFAGILTLTLYGITAAGASPALAARQRAAGTTTTTSTTASTDTAATTTTTAPRPRRTTTTTAPTAAPAVTHSLQTTVTPSFVSPDGSGTMTASPDAVSAATLHNTITFTYTAVGGDLSGGTVTLTVPSGWTTPSTSTTNAGYTTASCTCTRTISNRTITVSGINLTSGNTFTITYGDRSFGGAGVTAPTTPIVQTWATAEKSAAVGTLTPIGTSPSITVTAKDGTGTVTTPTTSALAGSTGNTIVFTFTAPAGGVKHAELKIEAPTGWSAPSTTPTDPGYFTASAGLDNGTDGPRMDVFDFTLPAGQTLTVTYGDKTGGGPGATAPATPASLQKWQAGERSSLAQSGAIKNLLVSPTITVNGADGAGTMTITTPVADPDPLSSHQAAVRANSTGNTIVFTFKAPAGGMVNGTVTLTVPGDWPAPSTVPTAPGFTKVSAGTLASPVGQTISVSGLTKTVGSTFTISYGVKTSGGPGATAPMIPGPETWPVQERSTPGGTLAGLGASPATLIPTHNIESNGSHGCNGTLGGGSGTFCFMPNGEPGHEFNTTTSGTVTFANFTGSTHDVDRCTPDVCNGVGPGTGGDANFGGSPDLHPGYQYSVTFNGTGAAAGTYNYRCSLHGYAVMHGTITVTP